MTQSTELKANAGQLDKRAPVRANADIHAYLADCRKLAVEEIRRFVPSDSALGPVLYDLMLDYPLREAKGLRPALCLAVCRALGGSERAALPTAAVIELYHNAFLVHDDVEDGSALRRDSPTLHVQHGVPVAINVGDGMLALALTPLIENTRLIGLGKALRTLEVIAQMARESAEGQAIELDWIRRDVWDGTDDDYKRMAVKKTGWYSFIAPVTLGAIIAGATTEQISLLHQFAEELGIAFQIRDDVLNLRASERSYGKEHCGDLWEGKRTLMLLHMMRSLEGDDRLEAARILACARPKSNDVPHRQSSILEELLLSGDLTEAGKAKLERALVRASPDERAIKTPRDVAFLADKLSEHGSIDYADRVGREHARRARSLLEAANDWLVPSVHRELLFALVDFTIGRQH